MGARSRGLGQGQTGQQPPSPAWSAGAQAASTPSASTKKAPAPSCPPTSTTQSSGSKALRPKRWTARWPPGLSPAAIAPITTGHRLHALAGHLPARQQRQARPLHPARYLTDRDIGGVIGKSAFVDRPGPHGMIIVAAGQAKSERALTNSQALIDELEHQIGLK